MFPSRTLLSLAMVTCSSTAATGQTILHTYVETEPEAGAGMSVAIWDDLDGDGYLEWVVGAPYKDGLGTSSGQVTVFSGSDHSVQFTLSGASAGSRLGRSLANVGDLDADGHDELAITADGEQKLYVYSGATATLLWEVHEAGDANFGRCVALATTGTSVITYSGDTGAQIWRRAVDQDYGWSLAGVGDIDADGHGDILVGEWAYFGDWAQEAIILGGADGSTIRSIPTGASHFNSQFGWAVAALGDQDGDGVGEYAIGDPTDASFGGGDGFVNVYSGASGALLATITPNEWGEFGASVANAGDVDADGLDDLLIGDPLGGPGAGYAYVYSVDRNEQIYQYTDSPLELLGASAAGVADVNGDGWPEALVGGGAATIGGPIEEGGAVLMTLGCPENAVYNYCTAAPNSTGQSATMGWQNTTSIANNDLRIFAEACPQNQFAMFFYGPGEAYAPLGDGFRCVKGPLYRLGVVQTGPGGLPSWSLDVTAPPQPSGQISAGETWFFQTWFRDPSGGPAGSNLSDALRITFCP